MKTTRADRAAVALAPPIAPVDLLDGEGSSSMLRRMVTEAEMFAGESGRHANYTVKLTTDREDTKKHGIYPNAMLEIEWTDRLDPGSSDEGKAVICVRVAEIDEFVALLQRVVDVARSDGGLPPARAKVSAAAGA